MVATYDSRSVVRVLGGVEYHGGVGAPEEWEWSVLAEVRHLLREQELHEQSRFDASGELSSILLDCRPLLPVHKVRPAPL